MPIVGQVRRLASQSRRPASSFAPGRRPSTPAYLITFLMLRAWPPGSWHGGAPTSHGRPTRGPQHKSGYTTCGQAGGRPGACGGRKVRGPGRLAPRSWWCRVRGPCVRARFLSALSAGIGLGLRGRCVRRRESASRLLHDRSFLALFFLPGPREARCFKSLQGLRRPMRANQQRASRGF